VFSTDYYLSDFATAKIRPASNTARMHCVVITCKFRVLAVTTVHPPHYFFCYFSFLIALARFLVLEFIHYSYFLRFLFFSHHSLALSLSHLCTSYFHSFFPSPLLIPLFLPSFFLLQFLFLVHIYEGWNFNSGNYLFTTGTK